VTAADRRRGLARRHNNGEAALNVEIVQPADSACDFYFTCWNTPCTVTVQPAMA
jgi:hypothetical protein